MDIHRDFLKRSMIRSSVQVVFLWLLVCVPLSAQSKLPAQVHQRLMAYIDTYDGTKLLGDRWYNRSLRA